MNLCPLTGQEINLHQPNPSVMAYSYETPMTGKVSISDIALMSASNLSPEQKQILAGICRNRTIKGEEPIMIKAALLNQLNDQDIPYSFEEKARHFLQFLYDNGGKEYKGHTIDSCIDSPIIYSSADEFVRVIKYLKSENWINYDSVHSAKKQVFYLGLHISKEGINEIEKGLPKIPMFGLINQKISTGDANTDSQIEHARLLFFDIHSTLESKRSACETLGYVAEPLRNELRDVFQGDTEVFFRIVNDFNVRHNKERTKNIEHEEQLEWIFYSLLNTINTYSKMKRKLG